MSETTPVPSQTPRRLSPLKGLLPFLRPYRARVVLAFVLLCLGSATILLVPLAFRDLIDFGFGDGERASGGLLGALSLNGHFIALFGLASFWGLVVSARFYTVSWIGERVTADLRNAVYQRVLAQSPQFFETLQTGEVLSRLTGDTTLIQTVVGSSISMGLRSLFQFIGGMIMLAVTSFYLFSLNLGLMALLILPILAIGRRVKKLSRESQDRIADASALAGEILNAMPTVQAFTQETQETRRFPASRTSANAFAINSSQKPRCCIFRATANNPCRSASASSCCNSASRALTRRKNRSDDLLLLKARRAANARSHSSISMTGCSARSA